MRLSYLVKETAPVWERTLVPGSWPGEDPKIASVHARAEDVLPGGLFIAIKGFTADGHDYIDEAVERGAVAVVAQKRVATPARLVVVKDTRKAMASIAARFYNNPSRDLVVTGISGTNGKTTTVWILETILAVAGLKTGVIGTVNLRYDGKIFDNPVTTPESLELQKILFDMKSSGVTHVIMEVSSHGIDLKRINHCAFDAAVFTNLSQDHLDYHKTMQQYFNCKKRFFTRRVPEGGKNAAAVINVDDEKGADIARAVACETYRVTTGRDGDVCCHDPITDISGVRGTLCIGDDSVPFASNLIGRFNLENILCAAGAAHVLGIPLETIQRGIQGCSKVPGRLEKIDNSGSRHIFVDYAHSPDALASILQTLKSTSGARLILVFGCGGDRDRAKRPMMGRIAAENSDLAIVTSDNPRTEDPLAIIDDILQGIAGYNAGNRKGEGDPDTGEGARQNRRFGCLVEPDRKKALENAVRLSKPGDIIVAAGKGHETYQILNTGVVDFDDRAVLKEACEKSFSCPSPIPWTGDDVETALKVTDLHDQGSVMGLFHGVSLDSRTIRADELFVAIKGDHFDGHRFLDQVLKKGVKGVVLEEEGFNRLTVAQKEDLGGCSVFLVADTLAALGRLARFQRLRSRAKVVAITGSNGKTSTREMTARIFETRFNTLVTGGNFNNEIGVPLTLFNLSREHEWAVVEMGMNSKGEIERLGRMARPDIAIVTNTADAHLEGLGDRDSVARAKAEIFHTMHKNGSAVLNGQDVKTETIAQTVRRNPEIKELLCFTSAGDAHVKAEGIHLSQEKLSFTLVHREHGSISICLNTPARFMVDNALAAACAGFLAGISLHDIKKGLEGFVPVPGRMNITRASGFHVIDDTYNANPESVKSAVNTLKHLAKGVQSMAVIGEMLELGSRSEALHYQTGREIADAGIFRLYGYGAMAAHVIRGAVDAGMPENRTMHGDKEEIAADILKRGTPGDWLLFKGSRGMKMETVLARLQQLGQDSMDSIDKVNQ